MKSEGFTDNFCAFLTFRWKFKPDITLSSQSLGAKIIDPFPKLSFLAGNPLASDTMTVPVSEPQHLLSQLV